ncbi:RecX family transcriptional regulator [Candidatus Sumerlaeota bacterium]|nr:RecX family transcriptional regulator [Candidatus Sumerlaeota bacterium]
MPQVKITSLKLINTRKELYRATLDNGESSELDAEIVLQRGVAAGVEFDEREWEELLRENELRLARKNGVAYVALGLKPSGQVRSYLINKGFSEDAVEHTLDHLTQRGYVNDAEYAARTVELRLHNGGKGPTKVRAELKAKGIPEELLDRAVPPLEEAEWQRQAAIKLAEKKFKTERETDPVKLKAKMYRFLAGRGFHSEAIHAAIDAWMEQRRSE